MTIEIKNAQKTVKESHIVIKNAQEALKEGHTHAKILIWANSGTGKTWLSATAPKPLIMLTEANGAVSVGHSNPLADIVVINTIPQLREIIKLANTGQLDSYDTLVFDSITEIQRMFKDEIIGNKEQLSIKEWGTLAKKMQSFIRKIRDLPFHIICTALADRTTDDEGATLSNLPQFEGKKTANEIMQFFTAVGYLFNTTKTVENETVRVRKLMFESSDKWFVKPCHPLGNQENPNMTEIIQSIITGEVQNEQA